MRVRLLLLVGLVAGCGRNEAPGPAAAPSASAPAMAASSGDGIDRVVAKLSASPLWTNGLFPKVDLPDTASAEQVLAQMFEHISFDQGKVTTHEIVKRRSVRIGGEPRDYLALVVKTNLGQKIVLLQYQGQAVGWWSRVFDDTP